MSLVGVCVRQCVRHTGTSLHQWTTECEKHNVQCFEGYFYVTCKNVDGSVWNFILNVVFSVTELLYYCVFTVGIDFQKAQVKV